MINKIVLIVDGIEYGTWKNIKVHQSLDQMAGAFAFVTSNKHSGDNREWKIKIGSNCKVQVDGQTIVDGYIDEILNRYDSEGHEIQFLGRDRTSDLVDCSFIDPDNEKKNEWKDSTLLDIIKDLCSPFGIDVIADATASIDASVVIPVFNIESGTTVSENIRSLCNMAGLLPITSGNGDLTITRSGTNTTNDAIETGVNVKSFSGIYDNKNRYSKYVVKGQDNPTPFLSKLLDITEPSGEALDNVITRYRPLIVLPEKKVNVSEAEKRARWEASTRAGKSRVISYTVVGWTQTNGDAWPLNGVVHVKDKINNINQNYLISELTFSLDGETGTTTELTLKSQETYNILRTPITKIKTVFDFEI